MSAARRGERVEVWFADEAGFGQKGTLTRVWAEKGTRPSAPKPTADGNRYVLRAVCPASGRAEGLASPARNTGVVRTFLDRLSATVPIGTHVALVWDGAGYPSASQKLELPGNMTAITRPPYAPALNPVERLWPYSREHYWSNRVYPDLDALEQTAVDGGRAVGLRPERVQSICRCEYLTDRS